jgi:hypothetical protein
MIHELVIYCFDKWWQATANQIDYTIVQHNIKVIVSPTILFNSKIVYDKTTKTILKNESNTSPEQIELEVWMRTEPLPKLATERNAFNRIRKSYERRMKFK